MRKKILVINGNPKPKSYCHELSNNYTTSSSKNNDVRFVSLSELDFEINLTDGYTGNQKMEPDLIDFQQSLLWSDHVVFVFPVWWGGMPAKLKGLIDRTFLPNFAFKYEGNKSLPEKLLQDRTAEVILTMDTPPFYYRWFQGNPVYKQLKHLTLEFCGFKQISATYIGPVKGSTQAQRDKWGSLVSKMASKY
ncbi:MAG: NAD(P)H-dependent oxidoreductase [Proteobacteria bacterium]|nr:NAD(P)H-dependent oxidoreductase [Pseudomonadota bacterium]